MKISLTAILLSLLASAGLCADCAVCHKTPAGQSPPSAQSKLSAASAKQRPTRLRATSDEYFAWSEATLAKADQDDDEDVEDQSEIDTQVAVADDTETEAVEVAVIAPAKPADVKSAEIKPASNKTAKASIVETTAEALATDPVAEATEAPVQIAATVAVEAAPKASVAWPQDNSDLAADPNAVFGNLENGLRYVILPTPAQPGRASLRLHVDVGSFMETDKQRGIAHFLEHMAFNGTKRFPAGETVEYFQRMGLSFGAHTNACTDFDSTVYQLELPRAGQELTEGIKYFRDVLDGMLLDEREIEKERGVVLREMSSRNSAELRKFIAEAKFALPGSRLETRLPIGTAECIGTMPRQEFVDFYETWYSPERAVVIVVGDVKVERVRDLIEHEFADAKRRRPSQPKPVIGEIPSGQGISARWHTEKDAASTTVALSVYRPASDKPDSFAEQRDRLVSMLSHSMLGQRLEKLSGKSGSIAQGVQAATVTQSNFVELSTVVAQCEPSQCVSAVGLLEREIRRAVKYGFTQSEFEEAKSKYAKLFERHVSGAETREPGALASEIARAITNKSVFTSPAEDGRIFQETLATLDLQTCLDALRKAWNTDDIRIFVGSNQEPAAGIEKKLVDAYRLSKWLPVSAPVEATADAWAYTDFGPAGEVVERKEQKDLEIVQARFANNIRVNVKPTTFEKNSVYVVVNFGGGVLEAPKDKPGLKELASGTFVAAGLQAHTLDSLNRALAGKNARVVFYIAEDAFQLQGQCTSTDLETQLQLLTAYLTAPAFRAETADQYQKLMDGQYAQLESTPEGMLQRQGVRFLRGGDARFGTPDREAVRKRTMDEVKALLATPLSEGYLEVSIVGDVDPDRAIELVAKTLGALPKRAAAKPAFAEERQVHFPVSPKSQEFRFKTDVARGMIVVAWPTADGRDFARECQLNLLASVLDDRVRIKVREELGAAYSPQVYSLASSGLPDYGFVGAEMLVEPRQAAEVAAIVTTIADELKDGAISDDEFERALKPGLNNIGQAMRNNGFWLGAICNCQERPEVLEQARKVETVFQSMTKAQIEALAKQYLAKDRATVVTLIPEKTGETQVSAVPATDAASR